MTRIKFLALTIFLLQLLTVHVHGQKPDNKKPMYGEVTKSEDYKKADESFIKSVTKQYGSKDKASEEHVKFGWVYFYNDSLDIAMKRFNQAWLLDPENPDSYFGFASLTEMKGNKTEAERFYKMGFEKDKNKNRAESCFQRIAECKEQLQDYPGTIEAYNQIVEINPKNTFAYSKLGYFNSSLGNNNEAMKNYSKAIELDPVDQTTYNNRGYLYHKMKNYPKAIEDYTKAIELNPAYISAYVNRGISKMESNDFNGAKSDFEKSSTLDPKAGELVRLVGLARLKLMDSKGACIDFEKARKLGDQQAEELIMQNCK